MELQLGKCEWKEWLTCSVLFCRVTESRRTGLGLVLEVVQRGCVVSCKPHFRYLPTAIPDIRKPDSFASLCPALWHIVSFCCADSLSPLHGVLRGHSEGRSRVEVTMHTAVRRLVHITAALITSRTKGVWEQAYVACGCVRNAHPTGMSVLYTVHWHYGQQ